MNNDDTKIIIKHYDIFKDIQLKKDDEVKNTSSEEKDTWTIVSNNGKLREDNGLCNINTIRIGPPQKKWPKINLTPGEGNEIVREWETYFNNTINNDEFSLSINAALIIWRLQIIQKQDMEIGTTNIKKITEQYYPLIEALCTICDF